LNGLKGLESATLRPSKKARVGNGLLVPKSVFIESSITSSMDDTPSLNASIKQPTEFGQHTLKKGMVLIHLKSIFDTAIPNVKSNQ
jgi:hypothetical protein